MLRVQSLCKIYPVERGRIRAGVDRINIDVAKGSFFTLLGPSGCGKTTTLRCIAGLEQPDAGVIEIGGDAVFDADRGIEIPINKRDIGMVFQSYAIWPHMTVRENVAFPLTAGQRRHSAAEIDKRVRDALGAVGLGELDSRSATQLSGGQQQRLALARAIIHEPSLLLLDEPLSNLDVRLRDEMRIELKRLQQEVGITAIYVTHDQAEALAMSDTIAVMNNGTIVQIGTPREIYHAPADRFVASFIGVTNFFEGVITNGGAAADRLTVKISDQCLLECRHAGAPGPGSQVTVSVRPEVIRLSGRGQSGVAPNMLHGTVKTRTFQGSTTLYHIDIAGQIVQVVGGQDDDFAPSAMVSLTIPADKMAVLPTAT